MHHPGPSAVTFEEELRNSLKRAPWLLLSAAFHVVLLLVLAQFPWAVPRPEQPVVFLQAFTDDQEVDPIADPPPDQIVDQVVEQTDRELDHPIVTDDDLLDEPGEPGVDFPGPALDDSAALSILGVGEGGFRSSGGQGNGRRSGAGQLGGRASQKAVEWGLDWLARHQDSSGRWSADRFDEQCAGNRCDGEGDGAHDIGVTGLSLLAFLGSGNTPTHGKYKKVVLRGLRYLQGQQDEETGCIGEVNSHQAFLYDHALATLALTEGYGLSRWPMLREPAQRAIRFIQRARNPYRAWRYAYPPDGSNDLSVTGWMVMCLKSADDFGLEVDSAALDGARAFIEEMTDPNTGRAGYLSRGGYSAREPGLAERWPESKTEAMTAVAMLCRVFLGEDPDRSPALRAGADLLRKQLPLWDEEEGTIDPYYWYAGSYAMFQMGGADWDIWQGRMLDAVVKTQRRDGDEQGSWDPQFGPWGHRGGRVYSTAIMTLCLEVYYRYDRLIAAR